MCLFPTIFLFLSYWFSYTSLSHLWKVGSFRLLWGLSPDPLSPTIFQPKDTISFYLSMAFLLFFLSFSSPVTADGLSSVDAFFLGTRYADLPSLPTNFPIPSVGGAFFFSPLFVLSHGLLSEGPPSKVLAVYWSGSDVLYDVSNVALLPF
jgi:hypothetical protein